MTAGGEGLCQALWEAGSWESSLALCPRLRHSGTVYLALSANSLKPAQSGRVLQDSSAHACLRWLGHAFTSHTFLASALPSPYPLGLALRGCPEPLSLALGCHPDPQ